MAGKKVINFLLLFSMLFNGGMVPTYILYTQYIPVKNTLMAYILPNMLMSAMNVMLVKNYYTNSIPHELFESARLGGASESRILFSIVIPLSKPILATAGLMSGLAYWNDWFNGMLYISDSRMYSIQVYLQQILANNEFARNTIQVELPEVAVRMAVAIVAVLPILIVYPFIQKLFVKGIAAVVMKG